MVGEFNIDFRHCPNLSLLSIRSEGKCPNFETCKDLQILDLTDFRSLSLDLSPFKSLERVTLYNIEGLELEFGDTPSPKNLSIWKCNLSHFNIPSGLEFLSLRDNQLKSIDLSQCKTLGGLDLYNNKLTELDVSACTRLDNLDCGRNFIEKLDLGNNKELHTFYIVPQIDFPNS
ncbi:hypothetical protein [Dysgonomonas sp. ZJ279]|uniref:hypothetical protein n=1 Tax=Dysgonomonas sp. ZJ279 TaxID=2709796 RepID=UPI0013EAF6B9|nr:hypothetical protein [Dysgonomonas sp. ZJ279]